MDIPIAYQAKCGIIPTFGLLNKIFKFLPLKMRIQKLKTEEEWKLTIKSIEDQIEMKCFRCGFKCTRRERNGKVYRRCSWSKCRFEESIYNRTIFEEARIEYVTILKIIRYWFSKVPNSSIAELLGIDPQCVTSYLKKASKMVETKYYNSLQMIGGPGIVVEVDESKFGKRKYHRGHRVDGCWVLGMVERTNERRLVCVVVPNRTSQELILTMKKYIHPESIIYSDCWRGYSLVNTHFSDHLTVNHSVSFVDFISGVHTNTIEGNWVGLKQGVPVQNRTKNRIVLYLLRYMFKRNSIDDPFEYFIKFLF